MSSLGIPVPPGLHDHHRGLQRLLLGLGRHYPDGTRGAGARRHRAHRAHRRRARFGDPENPLLVAVRSGARVSMPGMMDTVLNLGLNDATVEGLARRSGNPRFAYRLLPALRGDVRRLWCWAWSATPTPTEDPFEAMLGGEEAAARRGAGHGARRRRPARTRRGVPGGDRARALGVSLPRGPVGAAVGRDRRGLRARGRTPRAVRLPRYVRLLRRAGAPPSTCRGWSSATSATTAPPAWSSPATPPPASVSSAASS